MYCIVVEKSVGRAVCDSSDIKYLHCIMVNDVSDSSDIKYLHCIMVNVIIIRTTEEQGESGHQVITIDL